MTEWRFTDVLPPDRRRKLLAGVEFERIASEICCACSIEKPRTEWTRGSKAGRRPVFRINVPPGSDLVDQFHNGADGYRSRYLSSSHCGERANDLMLRLLWPWLERAWKSWLRRPFEIDWLKASLSQNSKVWIHQGQWSLQWNLYRLPRELIVDTWAANETNNQSKVRKKVRLGMLCPYENRLVVKGAFLDAQSRPVVKKTNASRAEDIHKYGFT